MEVVTGALPGLLPKLGALLIGEYNLQKGVKGEIMFLKAELEYMKAALEKISGTPANQLDIQDKIWARDVRELSYDIEDSIDIFMVRANGGEATRPHGFKKFIDRSLTLLTRAKIRRKIANDIKEIKIRVEEVSKRRDRYRIDNDVALAKRIIVDPRLFSRYEKATELVGIDDARVELITILMQGSEVPSQEGKVVSIVGFGGLGKTTLAKVVYENLRAHFDCSAFVSVSQTPDMEKLLNDLFYQLANDNARANVANELRDLLQNKRYFIIIDDLWDIMVWNMIRNALPDNNCGYKIMTTTRIFGVAEHVGRAYKLKPLSLYSSKILLYNRVFGPEGRVNHPGEELNEVTNRILKKCDGMPLAIITIASLLAVKGTNKLEWYEVYNSIVKGQESNPHVDNMRTILSLSYYDLPVHLRTCLQYISMFPEDYKIQKDRLIWLWIAEGIVISEEQSKSLFEVGDSYFNELVNRSMIEAMDDKYFGMKIYCHVHDMVLNLVRSLSSEVNFVTILADRYNTSLPNQVRRLSLQNGTVDDATAWASMSMQQVRSILVFPSAVQLMPSLGRFGVLRVLDLEDCILPHGGSLSHIGNLFHLRYLGLRGTRIAHLPSEIGNLRFLQTLDVTGTEICNLPSTILKLRHLMRLRKEWCRLPSGFGALTSLQELLLVWITDGSMDILGEVGHLTELRVLSIISFTGWTDYLEASLMECLRNLQKIQCLRIGGVSGSCNLDEWEAPRHLHILDIRNCCRFSVLPAWMNHSLRDLSVLSIAVGVLQQEEVEILGTLPALRYLELEVNHEALGIFWRLVVTPDSFPCLVQCKLWGFGDPVVYAEGAMPMLANLSFEFPARLVGEMKELARSLGHFDLGLGHLESLQAVNISLRYNRGTCMEEVDEAEDFLEYAIDNHPNTPSLKIDTVSDDESSSDEAED